MKIRGAIALAVLAAGCGADADGLTDGRHLTASLQIPAGTTMTIAPGARITAEPLATITVRGTLKVASAAGPHAVVAPVQAGAVWGGIIVEPGGKLDADGLDLVGPTKGVQLKMGSAPSRYDHGTIAGASTPFQIDRGAQLETEHVTVASAFSSSGVDGVLRARYLDYEKAQPSGGVILGDSTAVLDVSDSRFHGLPGSEGGDYLISFASALVRVTYTTITGAHCAFHFDDVHRFEIDHVTAGADSPSGPQGGNAWGAMLYGSGEGPHTISNSNFVNRDANLDYQGANGPITITNTFTTGLNTSTDGAWTWTPAEVAAAPILDARPR